MKLKPIFNTLNILLHRNKKINLELDRLKNLPRFTIGTTNILGKPFKFHDGGCFETTYREIFMGGIYEFTPSGKSDIILDCGANMGLSVIYFALKYPNHKIIAFEPEVAIFNLLQENVISFGLTNVTLLQKAVWVNNQSLEFYTDGGMGGRVNNHYKNQKPTIIQTVPLLDYLKDGVDFLKMDIEGAETEVLNYCGLQLQKAEHIFFEYHNDVYKKQSLHQLLALFAENGFHYYIKESGTRLKPFIEDYLICENFDMAINVFCYKEKL